MRVADVRHPTVEVHINTPLNHRGALDASDPFGSPDMVAFTFGTTFGIGSRSSLALGYVRPVTGPRPFDYENPGPVERASARRPARPPRPTSSGTKPGFGLSPDPLVPSPLGRVG